MNLLKWFRKNNKKIMAVAVIVIMFAFVGGSALRFFLQQGPSTMKKTVAYYLKNRRITRADVQQAQNELELLRALRADVLLRSLVEPVTNRIELPSFFLGELLFSETLNTPALLGHIRELIRRNGYNISLKQISNFYETTVPNEIYWLLLTKEAELAGFRISNKDTSEYLAEIIPKVTQGMSYRRFISALINNQGIPEEQILNVFGKLLAVRDYADLICSGENMTLRQIKHQISRVQETLDVSFVKFESSLFAEDANEPSGREIINHFEKYRSFYPGQISDENPYAFGYELPSRVQLEYLAVKLDDVAELIEKPTQQDAEDYYLNNKEQFTETVPANPNDPNSPKTQKTRSYPEVANQILNRLLQQRKNIKARRIIEEAGKLTEAAFENMNLSEITDERFKELAGDYNSAAEKIGNKYGIKVYTGNTGLLSAIDMRRDGYLGNMYVKSSVESMLGLTQLVFAIDELKESTLGPMAVQKPRMYQNISPVRDRMNRIMACVRITDAQKETVPQDVELTLNKETVNLDETDTGGDSEKQKIYTIKEKVVEDLKQLSAMDTAREKTVEFKKLIANLGWDAAVDRFNELYGKAEANETPDETLLSETEPENEKTFELINLENLRRISNKELLSLEIQNQGDPAAKFSLIMTRKESKLLEELYSLVPADSNSLDEVPYVLEFKPELSYYCIKNLSVNRVDRSGYQQLKSFQAYRENVTQNQSLAAVHFDPDNIVKRMNFRPVEERKPSDANAPPEKPGVTDGS